jgi:hypothetical protein
MAVNIGNLITAVNFNTLADLIDDWFSDGCAACSFGNGNQKFGWGGSTISNKNIGEVITAVNFNEMIDRINIGEDIVNGVAGALSRVSISNPITATIYNNIQSKEVSIRALKNTIEAAELSIHAGTTDARTTAWAGTINNVIRYTFANFNKARYLFNSGGALLISLVLAGGTTGNAANWTTLFSTMGTITMDFENTSQSGSGGTGGSIGYYDLTTNYQQIFTQSGTGAYTDNEIIIYARRSASGNYIEIYIVLNDDHAGTVNGTTTATYQYKKLDNQSSGAASLAITAPTLSKINTFE